MLSLHAGCSGTAKPCAVTLQTCMQQRCKPVCSNAANLYAATLQTCMQCRCNLRAARLQPVCSESATSVQRPCSLHAARAKPAQPETKSWAVEAGERPIASSHAMQQRLKTSALHHRQSKRVPPSSGNTLQYVQSLSAGPLSLESVSVDFAERSIVATIAGFDDNLEVTSLGRNHAKGLGGGNLLQ